MSAPGISVSFFDETTPFVPMECDDYYIKSVIRWQLNGSRTKISSGRSLLVHDMHQISGNIDPAFKNKVFLAFATAPGDITSEAIGKFRVLNEKYKFAAETTASQLSALAAAKLFVEGLTRAGHNLSREKLIMALESLNEYETGITHV